MRVTPRYVEHHWADSRHNRTVRAAYTEQAGAFCPRCSERMPVGVCGPCLDADAQMEVGEDRGGDYADARTVADYLRDRAAHAVPLRAFLKGG